MQIGPRAGKPNRSFLALHRAKNSVFAHIYVQNSVFSSISLREKGSKRPYLMKTQGVVGSES